MEKSDFFRILKNKPLPYNLHLISNAVQNAMVGPDTSLVGGLVAAAALFLLNIFLKKVVFRNQKLRDFILQKPEIIVHDGHPEPAVMKKPGISPEELEEAMREHGTDSLKEIKPAMFGIDGTISIITGNEHLKQTFYRRKRKHKSLSEM